MLDELLKLTPSQLTVALASLDTQTLIALANPRSVKPVKSRKQAERVIVDEASLHATYATAGAH